MQQMGPGRAAGDRVRPCVVGDQVVAAGSRVRPCA